MGVHTHGIGPVDGLPPNDLMMKTRSLALLLALSLCLTLCGTLSAATNDYQVTGPVLEVTDAMITVQKGKERWEIARHTGTKSDSPIKVGDKVTVHYTMTATKIEVKADNAAQAEGKSKK